MRSTSTRHTQIADKPGSRNKELLCKKKTQRYTMASSTSTSSIDTSSSSNGHTVKPYLFEPIRQKCTPNPTPEEGGIEEPIPNLHEWCECGNCALPSSVTECLCCQSETAVLLKMAEFFEISGTEIECITQHDGFRDNCLSIWVLEKDLARMRLFKEPEKPSIDATFRHIAYTNFVMWVHGRTGKGNRVVIPACATEAIRKQFPSEDGEYVGFRYPQPVVHHE